MSNNWSSRQPYGGPPQQQGQGQSYHINQNQAPSFQIPDSKLPVCFNCNGRHFLKDCPAPRKPIPAPVNPANAALPTSHFGSAPPASQSSWPNVPNGHRPSDFLNNSSGPNPVSHYPPAAPSFTASYNAPYAPHVQTPYQQYGPQGPISQNFNHPGQGTPAQSFSHHGQGPSPQGFNQQGQGPPPQSFSQQNQSQGPAQQFPPHQNQQQQYGPLAGGSNSYNQQPALYQNGPSPPQQQNYGYQGFQAPQNQYQPQTPQQHQPRGPTPGQGTNPQFSQSPHGRSHHQALPQNNGYGQGNNFGAAPQQQPASKWTAPPNMPITHNESAPAHTSYQQQSMHYQMGPNNPNFPSNGRQGFRQGTPQSIGGSRPQSAVPGQWGQNQSTAEFPKNTGSFRPPSTVHNQHGKNWNAPALSQGSPSNHHYGNSTTSNHSRVSSVNSMPVTQRTHFQQSQDNRMSQGNGGAAQNVPGYRDAPQSQKRKRSETPQEPQEEYDFDWEFEAIFKEVTQTECVGLAQTLSTNSETSPVLANGIYDQSVSRHAREDNLKEFTASIKGDNPLQWPDWRKDPAFKKVEQGSRAVAFEDLSNFMEQHHGSAGARVDTRLAAKESRKRKRGPRSPGSVKDENDQDDVNSQLQMESVLQYSNKRQKPYHNESPDKQDEKSTIVCQVTTAGGDDVWAPSEGERVQDPMEALLASLGVSGAPKPVNPKDPVYMIPEELINGPSYNNQQYRQDSGYGSGRGSYSAVPPPGNPPVTSEPSVWDAHLPQQPPTPPRGYASNMYDGSHDTPSPPIKGEKGGANGRSGEMNGESPEGDESPLSPRSREILGLNSSEKESAPEPKKKLRVIRTISGKNQHPRPQPVVAEAYSRRW